MSDTPPASTDAATHVVTGQPRVWPPLALALGCAAAYAVFFVLPYYVNGLDRFPLEDVAIGYHDPKNLWPYDTGFGGFAFGFGGLVTLVCGPCAAVGGLAWGLLGLYHRPSHDLRGRAALVMAVVVALGVLVWLFSPFGSALMQWRLD